ncbi:MAG: TolC family protein [Lachnospiraceae bacterium]|nr:TolC family protein [Lachnospiraceae bacterium]
MRKNVLAKSLIALLAAAVLISSPGASGQMQVQAAERLLTLDMVKKTALANSSDYEKLESELQVKEVSLKQAIKSIRLKQKNMSTFRWTPLLSFKFPEKPDLSEAYEFQFKPIEIQAEIDIVKHKMTDQMLAVYENVSNLYVDIVVLQDTISFNEDRLSSMETTLEKNRLRLKLGQATQSDIDAMEKAIKALNDKIAADKRSLEADKKKLSTAVGMDVTTGYQFENPFVDFSIQRNQLQDLIQYTLDRDENYYEVSMNATTSLISLRTNYNLMAGQYGGKMGYISEYVNQAIAGQKINGKAFKSKYEEFLVAIDAPWQGKKRILFIRVPREWFKGQISGIRYVEDEPYALYEAALEYQDALLEKNNAKQDLTQQVEDGFNNLISLRNTYMSLIEQVEDAKKQLEADAVLNRLGELSYDEYKASLDEYENMQNEMFEALALYSQALYSFDRLTCGGITALMEGTGTDLNAGSGGNSYVEDEYAEGAYYYIESIIQEQEFRVGVGIPDDFDISVSHFELWCDGTRIGDRTEIDKTIRHLALATDSVSEVKLRFYDGDTFIDDCVIDPDVYSGPLQIVKGYTTVSSENLEIGTYTSQTGSVTEMVTITLKPDASEQIAYYLVKNEDGKYLVTSTPIPINTGFKYLPLMQGSMEQLIIEFYGEDSILKYTGYFETGNLKLMKNPEGT